MQQYSPFVWHEVMVPNPSASPAFYSPITGWGTRKFDDGMDYTMWTVDDAPVGGLMALPQELASQGVPPHWLHYIGVQDVDATAARAQQLGGRITMPPTDIPDVGRFAVILDPQGAVFAIYKNTQETPPPGAPKFGEFSWHELGTTDRDAAWAFYSALFGWQQTSMMDMGGGMMYQMFGLDGNAPIGGMYTLGADMAGIPPNWLGYVLVKNVDDAVQAVAKGGGQLMAGPIDIPDGRVAIFTDPQGAAFAVHQDTSAR